MKKRGLFVLSIFIGIALLLAACGPDRQLGYQAVLTGPGGIPVANGNYTVLVKFWDDPTSTAGGDLIYSDTHGGCYQWHVEYCHPQSGYRSRYS